MSHLRAHVRAALEEASASAISVEDATADELIAAAERLGQSTPVLLEYIYLAEHPEGWSAADFARWVARQPAPEPFRTPDCCMDCGATLMGGATEHKQGCAVRAMIEDAFRV